jgi:hypothetical protein
MTSKAWLPNKAFRVLPGRKTLTKGSGGGSVGINPAENEIDQFANRWRVDL